MCPKHDFPRSFGLNLLSCDIAEQQTFIPKARDGILTLSHHLSITLSPQKQYPTPNFVPYTGLLEQWIETTFQIVSILIG